MTSEWISLPSLVQNTLPWLRPNPSAPFLSLPFARSSRRRRRRESTAPALSLVVVTPTYRLCSVSRRAAPLRGPRRCQGHRHSRALHLLLRLHRRQPPDPDQRRQRCATLRYAALRCGSIPHLPQSLLSRPLFGSNSILIPSPCWPSPCSHSRRRRSVTVHSWPTARGGAASTRLGAAQVSLLTIGEILFWLYHKLANILKFWHS